MANNNGSAGDISLNTVMNIVDRISQGNNNINPISPTMFNDLKKSVDILVGNIKDIKDLNKTEMKRIKDILTPLLKDKGLKMSPELNNKLNTLINGLAGNKAPTSQEAFLKAITKLISEAGIQSKNAIERGKPKEASLLGMADNKKITQFAKELAKYTGTQQQTMFDSAVEKLKSFMGVQEGERKKTLMALGASLVEGLENSKFVGGALRDMFTLIGLLGGSWLKNHFGELGKKLAPAFLIAMSVGGPILVNLLIAGLVFKFLPALVGKFLPALVGGLTKGLGIGKLAGGIGRFATGLGSKIGSVLTSIPKVTQNIWGALGKVGSFAMKTGALGKAVSLGAKVVKGGIPGILGGLAIEGAANFAMSKGLNAKIGHGISGAGQGALMGAFLGSVIPGLGTAVGTAVGAVVGGIAGVVKGFREDSKEHGKTMEEITKENQSWWKSVIEWFKGTKLGKWLTGGDSGESNGGTSGGGSSVLQRVQNAVGEFKAKYFGEQDKRVAGTIGDLQINKYGGMINIGSMNRMQASDAVQAYMQKDPTSFGRAYETVGSKHAYLGSFQNDLAIRDKKGNAKQAVLFKGAEEELNYIWSALQKAGMTQRQAEQLKYTSGRATATSKHKKSGKANSHDNIYSLVYDLGTGNNWSDKEWETAFNVLKPIMAEQGFDLKWEGVNKNKETIFGDKFVGGLTNRHFHVGLMKGQQNMVPIPAHQTGAEYDASQQEAQRITAQRHSLEAKELLVFQNRGDRKVLDELQGKSEEEQVKAIEKKLKDNWQIEYDNKRNAWLINREGTKTDLQLDFKDPTGNNDFKNFQLEYVQMLSNVGG